MPLDTTIPFRAMATVPLLSPQEHQQNALARQMQQLQLQNAQGEMQDRQSARAQQNALSEAYKSAYGADGQLDENALVSNLAKGGLGSQIPGIQKTFAEQKKARMEADSAKLKNAQEHVQHRLQLMSTVRDQNSHMQAIQRLKDEGEDVSDIPAQYDPAYYQSAMQEGLTLKERFDHELRIRQQTETERNNRVQNGISQGNLGVAQANLGLSRQRLALDRGPSGQKAPAGYRWNADGTALEAIPGGPASGKAGGGKAPTEFQAKSKMFGSRAEAADKIISDLGTTYSPLAINMKNAAGPLGSAINPMLNNKNQSADQAQRDFVNAVLRLESGAAISASEFDNAKKQYFPQPGDKPAVIKQKEANRKLAVRLLKENGGEQQAPAATGGVKFLGFE